MSALRSSPDRSSWAPHFGEPALSGRASPKASEVRTVFFDTCNLRCVYCQTWQIVGLRPDFSPGEVSPGAAWPRFSDLQRRLSQPRFVSPSHFCFIVHSIALAARQGDAVPLIYNTIRTYVQFCDFLRASFDLFAGFEVLGRRTAKDTPGFSGYVEASRKPCGCIARWRHCYTSGWTASAGTSS